MRGAGAGGHAGGTQEREGQSSEGGAGVAETAGGMADFLRSWWQL